MSNNHRNRNWCNAWTPERVSRTAVHKSGVTARAGISPNNPANDIVTLENTANIDLTRWDLVDIRTWQQWEKGDREMDPAFFELFKIKSSTLMSFKCDLTHDQTFNQAHPSPGPPKRRHENPPLVWRQLCKSLLHNIPDA